MDMCGLEAAVGTPYTQTLRQGLAVHQRSRRARMSTLPALKISAMTNPTEDEAADAIKEARLWRDNGWTARVIKNNDDDGWAVEMIRHGEPEPALVGPWTMGRDKKNPKPLDSAAFNTLVKTAAEVVRRHEQHLQALHHKEVSVMAAVGAHQRHARHRGRRRRSACAARRADAAGEQLAQVRVAAGYRLNAASARAWIEDDFRRPG